MRHVHFANDGLIDMRAVTVFGASSKETANPIGYFGTGLKYAIAVALRMGCKVTLYRDAERYTLFAKPTRIRVDDFDLVCMEHPDGTVQELAFTTELGKNWQAWQAFRELWCNALDEGGSVFLGPVDSPDEGRTIIEVVGADFVEWYNKRDHIMLMGAAKWMSEGVEIHYKKSKQGFYRNVRVIDLGRPAVLTYNIVGQSLDLTEDRTLKYSFQFHDKVSQAIASSDDEQLLREIIDAPEDSYEAGISFLDCNPGPAILALLGEERDLRALNNKSLARLYQKHKGVVEKPREIEPDSNEKVQLRRALEFLAAIGYDEVDSYDIVVTDQLADEIMGEARDGKIYLNRRTFMRGTKLVAGTLLEEYVHLHHALQDCSRGLQDWFLDALITVGEKFRGEPL